MKLYYQRFPDGTSNLGDDLNAWLWQKLIPDQLDDDERTAFVGIGTLLNDQLAVNTPNAKRWVIFSTGVGYFDAPPTIRPADRVYCVRGPLSAKALGLDPSVAVTDGAALIRKLFRPTDKKAYKFSYMPHIQEIAEEGWASICDELGFQYIDPRWPIDDILKRITQTEILLTEAMHGAIVADALRVPWVPVVTAPHILSFKWEDWCATVGVKFEPIRVAPMINMRKSSDPLALLRRLRYYARRAVSLAELRNVSRNARPLLSSERRIADLTDELERRLAKFQADHKAGAFREMP